MTVTNNILQLSGLTKNYGKKVALDSLDLNIGKGRIIGLLGPNGSGKTTLLKLINGLIQPTRGEVMIQGERPSISTKAIISYLPERTYLNEWMKIGDILKFFQDFYEDFQIDKARQMLSTMGLDEKQNLKTLSKGNKEKVQLVLVMSRKADLYLLDEPIGGVDPAARDFILSTILSNYSDDSTMIVSTHLIQDIEKIFDEVVFLKNGSLYRHAAVDTLREETGKSIDELFREVFKC